MDLQMSFFIFSLRIVQVQSVFEKIYESIGLQNWYFLKTFTLFCRELYNFFFIYLIWILTNVIRQEVFGLRRYRIFVLSRFVGAEGLFGGFFEIFFYGVGYFFFGRFFSIRAQKVYCYLAGYGGSVQRMGLKGNVTFEMKVCSGCVGRAGWAVGWVGTVSQFSGGVWM